MPRTKLSKKAKKNRIEQDEAMTALSMQYDMQVEAVLREFDSLYKQASMAITQEFTVLRNKIPQNIRSMTIGELVKLSAKTIDEVNTKLKEDRAAESKNATDVTSSTMRSISKKTRDDEGYLTEDSNNATNSIASSVSRHKKIPPTFSGLKKLRRSKSACGYVTPAVKGTIMLAAQTNDRSSRSKFRTPLNGRLKSASADRTHPVTPKIVSDAPLSLLRYPKVGETVISLSGSPVVVQSVSDSVANVNIPIQNGVISLRPTRMESVDQELITRIDTQTLEHIKQLQANLSLIMNFASDFST